MGRANAHDLDWETVDHGTAGWRRKRLGRAADGEALGCSLYELPPGKRSWPYHYHAANEEALYVLEGTGTLRTGDGETPVSAGDYVTFPAGERGAHRVVNESDEPLRYLLVSTMVTPDVTVYPDSAKVGVFVGAAPGGAGERSVNGFYRLEDEVGYWTGEDDEA